MTSATRARAARCARARGGAVTPVLFDTNGDTLKPGGGDKAGACVCAQAALPGQLRCCSDWRRSAGARHNPGLRTAACNRTVLGAMLCSLLGLSACSDFNWPFHRAHASSPASSEDGSDQCANLRAQIRDAQQERRQAPTTTTSPEIMEAAQAKADKRVEDVQQQYDALDCPEDASLRPGREPPLQPAPGGVNR